MVTSFQHPAVTNYRNISNYVLKVNEKRKRNNGEEFKKKITRKKTTE